MSSFSGRMLAPVRVTDQINWLRDQLFEQSYDDNIYIYVYIYMCGWIGYKKVVILAGGLTIQNEL